MDTTLNEFMNKHMVEVDRDIGLAPSIIRRNQIVLENLLKNILWFSSNYIKYFALIFTMSLPY